MLGITVPDAIAFGTMVMAVLAAWRGATQGTTARKVDPAPQAFSMAGAAMADTAAMQGLTQAVIELTGAVRVATERREDERTDLLRQMLEELRSKPGRR
jgi:hypothetical protein